MSDPLTFENSSPRFGLPFLYVGQAQKEFYVNEALARHSIALCHRRHSCYATCNTGQWRRMAYCISAHW
jgi:hypothetical protein